MDDGVVVAVLTVTPSLSGLDVVFVAAVVVVVVAAVVWVLGLDRLVRSARPARDVETDVRLADELKRSAAACSSLIVDEFPSPRVEHVDQVPEDTATSSGTTPATGGSHAGSTFHLWVGCNVAVADDVKRFLVDETSSFMNAERDNRTARGFGLGTSVVQTGHRSVSVRLELHHAERWVVETVGAYLIERVRPRPYIYSIDSFVYPDGVVRLPLVEVAAGTFAEPSKTMPLPASAPLHGPLHGPLRPAARVRVYRRTSGTFAVTVNDVLVAELDLPVNAANSWRFDPPAVCAVLAAAFEALIEGRSL